MPEHHVAAFDKVLAVLERAAVVSGEQPGERGLAVEQRGTPQIGAVEMQEVEQIVLEAVAAALAQVGLQAREVRRAPFVFHRHLAVEESGDDGESLERLLHGRKLCRPIESAAGLERHPATIDAGEQTVAVELDLVHPGVAGWWVIGERGKLRLDEGRQRAWLGA